MARATRRERDVARATYQRHLTTQRVTDRELSRVLKDAADEATEMIRRTTGRGIGAQIRRAQYMASRDALRRTMSDLWNGVENATVRGLTRAAAEGAEGQAAYARMLAEATRQEQIPAHHLRRMMGSAAETSGERVQSRLINDIDLSPNVYRNRELSMGRVDRVVNNAIATNQSAREIASGVRGLIRPDVRGGISYAAKRLGRTELNNAFHTTTVRHAQSIPFVDGMEWVLSWSHPREDICDDLAEDDPDNLGTGVYLPDNVPFKPHPQCLCHTANVMMQQENFDDALLGGMFDNWLMENGEPPMT